MDEDACGCMIYPTNEDEWSVDIATRDDDKGCYDATIQRTESNVLRIVYCTHEVQGMYDGKDLIVWADGKRWRRPALSPMQVYALRRRPYVPITLIAAHFIHVLATSFFAKMASLMSGTRAKTMRALMSWRKSKPSA